MAAPNDPDEQRTGAENGTVEICNTVTGSGWYILGENQQHIGPYALSELHDPSSNDAEFEKWQQEVKEADAKAEALTKMSSSGDANEILGLDGHERSATLPEGEREFTDDDGTTYKWDLNLRAWVPQDNEAAESGQYGQEEMVFLKEEEVFTTRNITKENSNDTHGVVQAMPDKKRKMPEKSEDKQEPNKPPESWFELKVNTHVYVTGLPDDVTVDEIVEVFSKCGIIKEDAELKKPIYLDKETGRKKGDALVSYMKLV